MGDVFPRRNLPPDAEQWGRTLETKAVSNEQGIEIVGQQVQSLNRNMASSLEVLAGQITDLAAQQQLLKDQQVALQVQQNTLTSTINFLSSQTLYDQKGGSSGGSKGGLGAGDFAYESFSGTYDCSLSVTTADSGKLLISVGAAITASGGGAGVGPEIVGVSSPTFVDSATAGDGAAVGASRSVVVSLAANTTYTVRTRRWWYGTTSQFVSYQAASLVVTRLA